MGDAKKKLIEFPCIFPLKAIGKDANDFERVVTEIVRRHVPDLADDAVTTRGSAGGKYLSVTATFIAESQAQLDAVYSELSRHEQVLFVL